MNAMRLILDCPGRISFVLRQAAEVLGIEPPLSYTASVDVMANEAQAKQALLAESSKRRPMPGDIMLMKRTATDWVDCGVLVDAGDESIAAIEGNTSAEGARTGTEVARRLRSFKRKDFITLSEIAVVPVVSYETEEGK